MRYRILAIATLILGTAVFSTAQTYNSNSGGWNTGYGTVYGSFGLAMATQNIYNTMQMQMQRSMMRQAMIRKWGKAAVEKAERNASGRSTQSAASSPSRAASGPVVEAPRVPKNYGRFIASAGIDTPSVFANALGENEQERELYKKIVSESISLLNSEAAKKGWKNDIAGAMTIFILTNSILYNDTEDPSDEFAQALYDSVQASIDELPEFEKLANKDKQGLYNTLLALSGIPLTFYADAKQRNDPDAIATARKLAGEMLKMVFKTEPERLRLTAKGFAGGY
ncbi:MAG TPA: hypothetical protein PLR83_05545 [Pyrinomonadaceae bacterium]|nr:hypothetical protein [Pyrinomonadaceae bacterium]